MLVTEQAQRLVRVVRPQVHNVHECALELQIADERIGRGEQPCSGRFDRVVMPGLAVCDDERPVAPLLPRVVRLRVFAPARGAVGDPTARGSIGWCPCRTAGFRAESWPLRDTWTILLDRILGQHEVPGTTAMARYSVASPKPAVLLGLEQDRQMVSQRDLNPLTPGLRTRRQQHQQRDAQRDPI
jgi:hypothetical protein